MKDRRAINKCVYNIAGLFFKYNSQGYISIMYVNGNLVTLEICL